MNIYKNLNELIEYIENNLENNIEYDKLAQILCTNEYTTKRIFSLLANVTLSEYIRNRRLSNAGFDLFKGDEKLIDVALKYQYESVTAFSRAFEKFHGIKPSKVKSNPDKLRVYTKLQFNENMNENYEIEYRIIELDEHLPLSNDGLINENNTFRWYKLNNETDFETVNKAYGNSLNVPESYPEIMCVETVGYEAYMDDAYSYNMGTCKKITESFWKELGVKVTFENIATE